jgi:endoglucanase
MDFLQIRNGVVAGEHGKPVMLRGVNIGGWMNLEHFLTGHSGAESSLRRTMAAHLGREKAAFFFARLLHHLFNEDDVRFLAGCGVTAIRLPLNYRHFESDAAPGAYLESGFALLDQALDWCERHGVYAILDLHSVPGWQNGDWHCDNSSRHALFWFDRQFQDRFVALWAEFARRYRLRSVVAAYNLVNEPLTNAPFGRFDPDADYIPDWPTINAVYGRTVDAIRAASDQHIVMLEGDYYSTLFAGLNTPWDANLLYSNHNYIEPAIAPLPSYPGTLGDTYWDAAAIRSQFAASEGYQFAQEHRVPLLVGEFGLSMDYPSPQVPAKVGVLQDQMLTYNRLGCHWTFWSYKALGSMGWLQTAPDSPYMRAIAPMLEAKAALGVDFGWLGQFGAEVQPHVQALADAIARRVPGLNVQTNFRYLAQAAMSTYTADVLQRLYAQQFMDKSETQIDDILASFALRNCVERVEMTEAVRAAATEMPARA